MPPVFGDSCHQLLLCRSLTKSSADGRSVNRQDRLCGAARRKLDWGSWGSWDTGFRGHNTLFAVDGGRARGIVGGNRVLCPPSPESGGSRDINRFRRDERA